MSLCPAALRSLHQKTLPPGRGTHLPHRDNPIRRGMVPRASRLALPANLGYLSAPPAARG